MPDPADCPTLEAWSGRTPTRPMPGEPFDPLVAVLLRHNGDLPWRANLPKDIHINGQRGGRGASREKQRRYEGSESHFSS